MNPVLLEASSLQCGYGKKAVIYCPSLKLTAGSFTCVLGPNGSGKSTLLKTLSGRLPPLAGSVLVPGGRLPVHKLPLAFRARLAAVVPQEFPAAAAFTVFDMILMGRVPYLELRAEPDGRDYEAAARAVSLLGLEHLSSARFDRLSGGQKRLVITARALASQAGVILLDEPDSGLDAANSLLLHRALRVCRSEGRAVLLCTHNPASASENGARLLLAGGGEARLYQKLTAEKLGELYGVPFHAVRAEKSGREYFLPNMEENIEKPD